MKNIETFEQFKHILTTCEFWGDTTAISTLERILNIKLIILSKEAYDQNDKDNVLLCGQLNDKILEERGEFKPDHYIIIEYNGVHYRLIKYKKRQSLQFKEIPYDIKLLIINKCMENQSGPFQIISEFREFNKLTKFKTDTLDELYIDDK